MAGVKNKYKLEAYGSTWPKKSKKMFLNLAGIGIMVSKYLP